ncbi:MAG: serine protease [Arenicella sp.]|jgi:serine protease
MAAPDVAGAAALLYSLTTNITPAAVESILKSTARRFPSTCSGCGTSIVDAVAGVATQVSGGGGKSNLSGSRNSQTFYIIKVPAGARNLSFNMSGGSGDADMYVRFAAKPTAGTFDCRPYLNGSNETCNFSSPSTGTYRVMIRGYSAYSGVRLIANYN